MKHSELHVVIGAGIIGCLTAVMRSRAGYSVILLEREQSRTPDSYPICLASSNIVSENHSGAEYPFDPQSARDCLDGRIANERFFPDLIFGGKDYTRIIASGSMQSDGTDIVGQCRSNMNVIRSHYASRCAESDSNAVFGDPRQVCRELRDVPGVRDVGAAFVTPQRGINPVAVAAVLDWELRQCGVDFRDGTKVTSLCRLQDGRYDVEAVARDGSRTTITADQVSICSATETFAMARQVNGSLELPEIYMALRQILFVDLPEGTEKTYTCLKLEDSYGGMFSPFGRDLALVYYPPTAHIESKRVDPATYELPAAYRRYLEEGHPEMAARADDALKGLRQFYPELSKSNVMQSHLKIALNTVNDSRVRRNFGVVQVAPGCTANVLLKWTMCVVNARRDLEVALAHSSSVRGLKRQEAEMLSERGTRPLWEAPATWAAEPARLRAKLLDHATSMHVPSGLAAPFEDPSMIAVRS